VNDATSGPSDLAPDFFLPKHWLVAPEGGFVLMLSASRRVLSFSAWGPVPSRVSGPRLSFRRSFSGPRALFPLSEGWFSDL